MVIKHCVATCWERDWIQQHLNRRRNSLLCLISWTLVTFVVVSVVHPFSLWIFPIGPLICFLILKPFVITSIVGTFSNQQNCMCRSLAVCSCALNLRVCRCSPLRCPFLSRCLWSPLLRQLLSFCWMSPSIYCHFSDAKEEGDAFTF